MATKKTRPAPQPKPKTAPQSKSRTRVVELPLHVPAAAAKAVEAAVVESTPAESVPPAKKAGNPAAKKPAAKAGRKPASPATPARVAAYSVAADSEPAGREVLETCMICGTIAAKGVESLGKEVVSFARASARTQFALTEALLEAKTMQEAIEAQHDFTRESFDNMAAEWAKLTGMTVDLSRQLMEPIQARVNAAPWAVWEPLAA